MALEPGDKAPDFELPDQHGNPVKLSGLRGKTVALYFYPKAETRSTRRTKKSCLAGRVVRSASRLRT
jgi:peroxiredoxin